MAWVVLGHTTLIELAVLDNVVVQTRPMYITKKEAEHSWKLALLIDQARKLWLTFWNIITIIETFLFLGVFENFPTGPIAEQYGKNKTSKMNDQEE